jgi:uncharacterized protein YjbI with pentapeptide repeats
MKKLILISALLLVAFDGWAYNETDLAKFKALNVCERCDLSEIKLRNANLGGANLTTSNLRNAKLDGAKFCKTQMPWGEVNDDCED